MARWSTGRIVALVVVGVVVIAAAVGIVLARTGDGPTAATIGDSSISRRDFTDELRELANNDALREAIDRSGARALSNGPGSVTADIGSGWLSLLVSQEVAAREVERQGLEPNADDRERGRELAVQSVGGQDVFRSLPSWFRDRLLDRWTKVATLERSVVDDPSSGLAETIAEQCPSGRYVSHILVESDVEAAQILAALEAGEDFADLARTESFDTGSAQNGGALGCVDGQEFVEPFATVARTQPIGEVSQPFTTEFGTHIVLVTDEPPQAELERAALENVLGRARGESVEIDPRFGRWDRRNGQVLPPLVPA